MNRELTTLPEDWRPLREAAETMAPALYAVPDWYSDDPDPPNTLWSDLGDRMRDKVTGHVANLLADLTRPASRDFWARWLAERVGFTVGATAPVWVRVAIGSMEPMWRIMGAGPACYHFTDEEAAGIGAVTDPAAALQLAILAVGGKS